MSCCVAGGGGGGEDAQLLQLSLYTSPENNAKTHNACRFSMWTGIVSLEGTEYYLLAPLTVLSFVGIPMYFLHSFVVFTLAPLLLGNDEHQIEQVIKDAL